jgi:hypothetical protein
MERRTFLLGLLGGLAAAAGFRATGARSAQAQPVPGPTPNPDAPSEAADIKTEDLDAVRIEEAQYYYRRRYRPWRRRYYRRYWRPRRRYWRRWRPSRVYYRRYWRPRRRYWRRRYWRRRYW